MKKTNFWSIGVLMAVMLCIKLYDLLLDPNKYFVGRTAEFSWNELLITVVLALLGLWLYEKAGFKAILNKRFLKMDSLLITIFSGLALSLILVCIDYFARIGDISVGWPLSIPYYIWGAISTEIIFRLFAISLLVWLFSVVIFHNKYTQKIYWIIASLLSLLVAGSMLMAFSIPDIPLHRPSDLLFYALGLSVFISEMMVFYLLKSYGFASTILFRLSFYGVWHVCWPLFIY